MFIYVFCEAGYAVYKFTIGLDTCVNSDGCWQPRCITLSHPMADSQMYVVKRNGKKQDSAKFGGEKFERFEAVDLEVEELKL